MPEKLDLQGLTTKEIAEQYEKTRQEALKQRRFRASDTYPIRRGFEGDTPEYRGRNKTQLDEITDFVNSNLNDPQIAELLPHPPTNTRSDRTAMGNNSRG